MFQNSSSGLDETIAKAKRGDKDALSKIWTLLNPSLVRYLSSLGCDFAEDVASESWISLAKILPKFQGGISALQGLLFQIARARLYDHLRKESRRTRPVLTVVDERTRYRESQNPSESQFDGSSAKVSQWLERLPTSQAEVVVLRVIVGLSHSEISQIIGKSEGAVRILFHRGLDNLERILLEEKNPKGSKKFTSLA